MTKTIMLLLLILSISSVCAAQDSPSLTTTGLEDFYIGKSAPKTSSFPGLTHFAVVKTESQEGELTKTAYLKLFQNGHYLGKARLGFDGKIDEIVIVSPRAKCEAGYAVGDTWSSAARSFPMGKVYYTYVSDSLFAQSESVGNLQLHFNKSSYNGKRALDGELQSIAENHLAPGTKITKIRIY